MSTFSRDTFDMLNRYVGVRLHQGVPVVDADWNEQDQIRKFELETFLKWFVGNGVPLGNDGFRISTADLDNDFEIAAGRCFVEGWDVIGEAVLRYTQQPLFQDPTLAVRWGVPPLEVLETPPDGPESPLERSHTSR